MIYATNRSSFLTRPILILSIVLCAQIFQLKNFEFNLWSPNWCYTKEFRNCLILQVDWMTLRFHFQEENCCSMSFMKRDLSLFSFGCFKNHERSWNLLVLTKTKTDFLHFSSLNLPSTWMRISLQLHFDLINRKVKFWTLKMASFNALLFEWKNFRIKRKHQCSTWYIHRQNFTIFHKGAWSVFILYPNSSSWEMT